MTARTFWPLPAIALGLAIAASPAGAQVSQTEVNAPTIVTSGEAVVRRAPDRALVNVTVETRARRPRDAQSENAGIMTRVQQQLRSANLPKDAVRTLSFTVEPEFDFTNGRQVLRGYVARNAIEVRVDDLVRLGEIIDGATNAGATSVGGIQFDLKDRQAAERQALGEAVADARARAEAIAAAAGRPIQTIWRITDESAAPPPVPRPTFRTAMSAEAAPTPIVAGDIEIRGRVTLVALIK